ncbi:MAG: hypothetical protein ACK4P4_13280 [Allorhizobium sp.]
MTKVDPRRISDSVQSVSTGAKTILAAERGALLRKTGAAATWSPQNAVTMGNGWYATIRVEDNDLTIDPQGAETIDGAATAVIPAGYTVELTCNGTAFFTSYVKKPRVTGLFVNSGSELVFFKRGTLTHDFTSIPAGGSQFVDVAVSGALVVGHHVMVNSNNLADGVILTGRVITNGSVRIFAHNPSSAAIDPGLATLSWAVLG